MLSGTMPIGVSLQRGLPSQFGTGGHWLHLIQRTNTDSIILGQYFVSSLVQQRLKDCFRVALDFLVIELVIECSIVLFRARSKEKAPTNCGSRGQLLDYRVIFQGSIESFENSS
ncbi:hypothetical protein HZH66_010696 [Vespula vulgaris]|uniref:Uncharacterized protein n=1 Tax=Vespula vulgaris TaxID=7454 RepID=A0A834JIZ5_VESVU|nr:hypothetical protein HZH66_010696 [Vespula vulgaris]